MRNGPIHRKPLRLSLIFLLPLLLLSTCKKDDCPDEPTETCPCEGDACIDEMMDYTYFLPGTWWVYEEQTSGYRDSVYVYEASSSVGSDGSHHFLMRTHSTYDEYNYYYQFTESLTQNLNYPQCKSHKVKRTKTRPGDFVGTATYLLYPAFLNDVIYPSTVGDLSVDSLFETYELSNNLFENVIYYDIDQCDSEDYDHAGFHIASNFGIIKKSNLDQNQFWILISYNIIQ